MVGVHFLEVGKDILVGVVNEVWIVCDGSVYEISGDLYIFLFAEGVVVFV